MLLTSMPVASIGISDNSGCRHGKEQSPSQILQDPAPKTIACLFSKNKRRQIFFRR